MLGEESYKILLLQPPLRFQRLEGDDRVLAAPATVDEPASVGAVERIKDVDPTIDSGSMTNVCAVSPFESSQMTANGVNASLPCSGSTSWSVSTI